MPTALIVSNDTRIKIKNGHYLVTSNHQDHLGTSNELGESRRPILANKIADVCLWYLASKDL